MSITDDIEIRKLARKLAKDCVVTDVLAKYLENVLRAVYEDEIKPLREALEFIRAKGQPQTAYVADRALKGEKLTPLR